MNHLPFSATPIDIVHCNKANYKPVGGGKNQA